MKAYTNVEQSRKLMEFLPLDSADCYWSYDSLQGFHRIEWFEDWYNKQSQLREKDIPCWSLAALLSVIAFPVISQKEDGGWEAWSFLKHSLGEVSIQDDPVDACVDLIISLNSKR